jgi:dTDP-4-amino-4,6-dideoxygalactose transaminase
MPIPVVNPKAQNLALKEELSAAVQAVLDSGAFVLGPNMAALEAEVAQACEAGYGVAVNSGTDALVIALAACGVGPGDEVITTPFTFVATTEAIVIVGAKPIYADIDPTDFNLDPAQVESKISPRTRAILPVHLYGQCADATRLEKIAAKNGLRIIYDGAQAVGSLHKGKGIGAYGDASTLSFYPTKNLGACGDGGMVLTDREEVYKLAKSLRFHGQGDIGHDSTYTYEHVGYCTRLDEFQAAVLRVKLKYLKGWNEARRAIADRYIEALGDLPIELPVPKTENYHIYHQFTIRFARRNELAAKLAERGIGSKVFYPSPLHLEYAYRPLGYKPGDLPESEKAAQEVLSLPMFPELSSADVEQVITSVRECVSELMG